MAANAVEATKTTYPTASDQTGRGHTDTLQIELTNMKRFTKALLSKAAQNQSLMKIYDLTFAKVSLHLSEHRRWQYEPFYDKVASFTRLPKGAFCKNLTLVEKYRSVAGDVVECGVWRGGMSAGLASILGENRNYYLFDSFEGLPEATSIDGKRAIGWQADNAVNNCRTEEHYAHDAMALANVETFHVIKGWFNQTLPSFKPAQRIAVLRLDADWYSSTAECLNHLYDKVVPGGLIILDDYYTWDGCSRALHDFLSVNKSLDRIQEHDGEVCYIRKTDDIPVTMIDPRGHEDQASSR